LADASQENDFIKFAHCPRTVYVDNLGVSTFAFTLEKKDSDKLITSGKYAILDYLFRAKRNFKNEGEKYH